MSDNKEEKSGLKRKTSIWAKISLFCAILGWLTPITAVLMGERLIAAESRWLVTALLNSICVFTPALFIIAFITAIVGVIHIRVKRQNVKGWGYIIFSLVLILLFITVLSVMVFVDCQ